MTHGVLTLENLLGAGGDPVSIVDTVGVGPKASALDLVYAWNLPVHREREMLWFDLDGDDVECQRGERAQ